MTLRISRFPQQNNQQEDAEDEYHRVPELEWHVMLNMTDTDI